MKVSSKDLYLYKVERTKRGSVFFFVYAKSLDYSPKTVRLSKIIVLLIKI